jgi:hypothetical protein
MQCACAILSSVACLVLPDFFRLTNKQQVFFFGGGGILKCVFWFTLQILSEMFIILRRNERDGIINVHRSSHKVPDILVRLQRNLNFLNKSSEKFSNIELHENPYTGSQVVTCRRTDMTALINAFRNFAKAPKE